MGLVWDLGVWSARVSELKACVEEKPFKPFVDWKVGKGLLRLLLLKSLLL